MCVGGAGVCVRGVGCVGVRVWGVCVCVFGVGCLFLFTLFETTEICLNLLKCSHYR